ncbi:DUF4123 domain-containing protein [Burkholderia sp. Ac-20353]|uniref:DUF4123 domain-containing protein n=1 Tax=Burkholderia sp. Ac-20353 TaxID=2703894 RepID=UPI00197B552B|nr:DUF4123 domain-containing protein [Burkholderia sp. Ac-20353]MBN3787867.1 DUF4123 domain-containing protein [Burkholderia sp. Ac-20353]
MQAANECDLPHAAGTTPGQAPTAPTVEQLQLQCDALGLSHCLLLTGPAVLHAFEPDEIDALKAIGESVVEVPLCPERLSPDYWPSVIELDLAHPVPAEICRRAIERALDDWSPDALGEGRGHRVGAFLFSDARTDAIARHLAHAFVQQRPDGDGQRLLGLADPAAFEGVWRVCDDAQRRRLLGPIAQWRTLGRWGEWVDCDVSAARDAEPAGGRSLDLRDAQWSALFDVRPINRAWARASADGCVVQRDTFERLPAVLQRAHGYGLSDPQDLELFARHALNAGAEFDRHPRIQRVLRDRPADMYYSLAVADLGDADWAEIRGARPDGRASQ